jgi:Tol biopolymer transport system component
MPDREFSKVEKLYRAALERPASDREAFLEEACGGDEGLLREVTSLLSGGSKERAPRQEPTGDAATPRSAVGRGTRFGPYEVLEALGVGGMGEVYRARDTRLDRTVALKVLRSELASDPRLKARFEREARAVSALAHPNICTLYDIGEEDGQTFLVMEHLVGQTLAERLEKGPLPVEQALEVATQVADGLAAAHRQGIVHRDLKPGNVMLTKTGARLLDFGLARLTGHGEQPAVESLTSAPTKQAPLTGQGTILGTLPYMAPEQVEGKPADARTDLWALGTILYEVVTGGRAFDASTPVSLVGAILEREPAPLRERQPLTPPSLERLVQRCLAKDPDERWDTAHDVAVRLREIAETDLGAGIEAGRPTWRGLRPSPLWMAGLVVVSLLAGGLAERLWLRRPERARAGPVVRSTIDLTADWPLRGSGGVGHPLRKELALSPDGTLLAWTGDREDDQVPSALYVRRLDTGEVTRLQGTEGASQPSFSPDGRWIAFSVWDQGAVLRKVSLERNLTVDVAELSVYPMGVTWAADGKILLGMLGEGIQWVPAEGDAPRQVTTVDLTREGGHRLPWALPGGRALLFTTLPTEFGGTARIESVVLASGERTVVVEDGTDARYLPTGHLIFMRRGILMAAPFDLERLELTAAPVPILEGVSQAVKEAEEAGLFEVSDAGDLVYAPGSTGERTPVQLVLLDETGRAQPLPGFDKPTVSPQLRYSPDGRRLVFIEQVPGGLLWLFDLERHTYRTLSDGGIAASPRWSPDGRHLVVSWAEAGPMHLWTLPAGGGPWQRLTEGERHDWAPSWSPDGTVLAFERSGPPSGDLYVYRFEDRQAVPFLATKAQEGFPEFSRDGRWLAYASNESGRNEVYVTSFPDREQTLTVSRHGGMAPAWSADGTRLFYYTPPSPGSASLMITVTVRYDPELSLGPPTELFPLPERFIGLGVARSYELHPDGRRFLVGVWSEQERPEPITRLTLVHNWFAELERLIPTGR